MATEQVDDPSVRAFLQIALSSTIITKSGGVSLARDLGHTRPHHIADRVPRSALGEFEKRILKNLRSLKEMEGVPAQASVALGDSQHMPLASESVDLIVTSPPYASNAIDYMRAHKFSLVWLGHLIDELSRKRREYIGSEATTAFPFEALSPKASEVTSKLMERDSKKGLVLQRYYSEMTRCIREMHRVLRPGKAAIVVVGTSLMRGLDTLTHECLADIGRSVGFDVVGIATRRLDRDRRMMPARSGQAPRSQIEQRMHEEFVIALYKPE
jgi:DNA modification methylase